MAISILRLELRLLPARIVNANSGLYLEWNQQHRARVAEASPVVMTDEGAWHLIRALGESTWTTPPSMRKVQELDGCLRLDHAVLNMKMLKRAWLVALYRYFGPEVVCLTLKIFPPRQATITHLFMVQQHFKVLQDREREQSNLMPLLRADPAGWASLQNWKQIKSTLLAMGLTARAWRWMSCQSRAYLSRLDWTNLNHLAWVNFHAALGINMPAGLIDFQTGAIKGMGRLQSWLRRVDWLQCHSHFYDIAACCRLMVKHWLNNPENNLRHEMVDQEFPLIVDWMMGSLQRFEQGKLVLTRTWNYGTLINKQVRWHLLDFGGRQQRQNLFWPELLGQGKLGHVTYIELCSLHALLQEAKRMHHCVPSYIESCLSGEVVLFHLQGSGGRPERATAEFRNLGLAGWMVAQIKGPCNQEVSVTMRKVASELAKLLNRGGSPGVMAAKLFN